MKVSPVARLVTDLSGKPQLEVAGRLMFELNPVAAFIWRQLASNSPTDVIIVQLVDLLGASQEQATRDVANFLELLKKHWLAYDDEQRMTSTPTTSS